MMININIYVINIVKLNTINIINKSECSFHSWHYITIFFQFSVEDFIKSVCLNTNCIMLLIDWVFLHKYLSDIIVQKTINKITVQDISSWMHKYQKYVQLKLYLSDTLDKKTMMTYIVRNVHLVDNLQTNFLVNMNIIGSEHINMNILL